MYNALVLFIHRRTAYTAVDAGGHFYKALSHVAVYNITQSVTAVLHTVYRHIEIFGVVLVHRTQNARCRGIQPCLCSVASSGIVRNRTDLYVFFFEPACKLLKCKHAVYSTCVSVSLRFFRKARANEHGVTAGIFLLEYLSVRKHGRFHLCKIGESLRVVFLYKRIYRVTARAYDYFMLAVRNQLFILLGNKLCALGGFLRSRKAQLFKSVV